MAVEAAALAVDYLLAHRCCGGDPRTLLVVKTWPCWLMYFLWALR